MKRYKLILPYLTKYVANTKDAFSKQLRPLPSITSELLQLTLVTYRSQAGLCYVDQLTLHTIITQGYLFSLLCVLERR